ncbi:MAG: saccharopine dehydrogenase NADP-binding domain-containing protein [Chitinophagaceae bacterium]|nr:saccharopine dehydrogenase NADP-binding domain-containing protein [Chitinophagaceae bacterium]MCW5925992.1 saccharopine dehydrogenase NADP-binding domain-containing protein [Chitinophagaceae bacterium]
MKTILLFGAGKSATCLIDYLISHAPENDWQVVVADNNLELAKSKTGSSSRAFATAINITDDSSRKDLIRKSDIVISLMPPSLHSLVAQSCLQEGKDLLTASYADGSMQGLKEEVAKKGLLFLCEMGLDPGIDHMSAMEIIHGIHARGGEITSFFSHCGGLVAPESDDNPWHYKISWNPRNIVLAGKSGAAFRKNGIVETLPYNRLFNDNRKVSVPGYGEYAWYPNRDSIAYSELYGLENTATFIRTTLRHPVFCSGWKRIADLGLTDDLVYFDSDNISYRGLTLRLTQKNAIGEETPLQKKLLQFLGLYDTAIIGRGKQTAADILQSLLETRLMLHPADKDMIIMLHEFEYLLAGITKKISSCLVVKGENGTRTAMAKTVGLPLGIAAKLVLQKKICLTGLHIPVLPEIYSPVLAELKQQGIAFQEFGE